MEDRHINERTGRKKVNEYTRNSSHIHHLEDNEGGKKSGILHTDHGSRWAILS